MYVILLEVKHYFALLFLSFKVTRDSYYIVQYIKVNKVLL